MPIVDFENVDEAVLVLVIMPCGERHEIPHLARAGVRYALREGSEDRCYSGVSKHQIEFWCDADSYEIDIVLPSAYDKLLWDICLSGGWCGGLVDGKPTHVNDLLPASGTVTAQEFARLTVKADGWPASEPPKERHLRWLEAKFIEHLGSQTVDAKVLRQNLTLPFERDAP
jgi:hypothetical protein